MTHNHNSFLRTKVPHELEELSISVSQHPALQDELQRLTVQLAGLHPQGRGEGFQKSSMQTLTSIK